MTNAPSREELERLIVSMRAASQPSAAFALTALLARLSEVEKALEFYATGGNTHEAASIARGDVDLAQVSEVLTEDCGDVARAALQHKDQQG